MQLGSFGDLLGRTLYTVSCDAGARWSFMNAMGKPIRVWDNREYDQIGNILKMNHDAQSCVGDWTRHYHIAEMSNRLLDTSLPGDDEEDAVYSAEYTHDAHGNMLTMPHLSDGIDWDFKDQMHHVDKGGGGDVYFVYDASGQRIRKVWEHSGIVEERIYLGGFELYRRHESGDVVLERETLHIMDDQQRIAMVETKTIDEAADPFTIRRARTNIEGKGGSRVGLGFVC